MNPRSDLMMNPRVQNVRPHEQANLPFRKSYNLNNLVIREVCLNPIILLMVGLMIRIFWIK